MENNKYYPLRVGKFPSCIVSDMPVTHRNKKDMDDEWEHYGGFVIAESIPKEIAQEFVALFNKKYECTASPGEKCMGGRMCCQGKISHHEWVEQQNAIDKENALHSFTEGYKEDDWEAHYNDINWQIQVMESLVKNMENHPRSCHRTYKAVVENLKAIKRWNESPVYQGEIDVAKVIEDLVAVIEAMSYTTNSAADFAALNGHKAIEMINRFKEEREAGMAPREAKPLTQEAKNWVSQLAKEKRMSDYIPQVERDLLVNDLTEMLPFDRNVARKTANTIVTAIESMDTLKRKYGR